MNNFQRSNKVSGVHWLKKSIGDIEIKLQLKCDYNMINIPQLEQFPNANAGLQQVEDQRVEQYTFKWQEKVYSTWELSRYSDPYSCITETELQHHELIQRSNFEPKKVFTYIHEDRYSSPSDLDNNDLSSCFARLDLNDKIGRLLSKETGSMGHLFRSEEVLDKDHWVSMHVVFDDSDYNEDSQLLFKRESLLLSLHYNAATSCLVLTPDVNHLEWNPYLVEGVKGKFIYGVGVEFSGCGGNEELVTLLSKLQNKWLKKSRPHLQFMMPPLGKRQCLVTLEIVSAREFDLDNLHIEFHVKVPEDLQCEDKLNGRTHTTRAMKTEEDGQLWLFGHIIELCFILDVRFDPSSIKFYFEVISNDWWNIQRTEGYAHLTLPLNPGHHTKTLDCIRPEEKDRVQAEERRFFVGGCNLIEDLDVLGTPQMQNLNFRLVSSGKISVRHSVITQCHLPGTTSMTRSTTPGSSSDLLLGAEAVLKQYRMARARLAAATKDLDEGNHSDQE